MSAPTAQDHQKPTHCLWLVYFPRACHHLFMRMFAKHTGLEILEVLKHTAPSVGPTIELSAHRDLDNASELVVEACQRLRERNSSAWEKWMLDLDEFKARDVRAMSSCSVAFQISPAVHNWWLHHVYPQSNGANGSAESRTYAAPARNSPESQAESSPKSLAFWRLRRSGGSPANPTDDNPTPYPKSFLQAHQAILLIRHPVRAFPSTVRLASQYFDTAVGEIFMNLILRYRWHRLLYDWYAERSSSSIPEAERAYEPLVLDADDLMYNREAVEELCRRAGLNPEETQYQWTPEVEAKTAYDKEQLFLDTLTASSGVVEGKGSDGVTIEQEFPKWMDEFGEQRARRIRQLVLEALDDYEYLRERSVGSVLTKK